MSYIEIKSNAHPDTLCDILSEEAIYSLERYNREKGTEFYGFFDNSYLKCGKFPAFKLGGYLSFDFREHDKNVRYDLFQYVKSDIIKRFKEIFPEPSIQVDFDLNLEPSGISDLAKEGLYTDTSMYIYPLAFSSDEKELMAFEEYVKSINYTGSEYKISLSPTELVVNQTFNYIDEDIVNQLREDLLIYLDDREIMKSRELIVNPDYVSSGKIYWCRFGSSVFHNGSGSTNRSNQWYGCKSTNYPECHIFGKHNSHPTKYFADNIEDILEVEGILEDETMILGKYLLLWGTMGKRLGEYIYEIK